MWESISAGGKTYFKRLPELFCIMIYRWGSLNTGPKSTKTASKWPFACVPLGWKSMLRSATTSITGGECVNEKMRDYRPSPFFL